MSKDISYLALQPTSVIDALVTPFPELPDSLKKFPGSMEWWAEMKLSRERDKETLFRMILTKITNGIANEGSAGINKFTTIGKSSINPSATINTQTSTSTTNNNSGGTAQESDDALLLAWSGL